MRVTGKLATSGRQIVVVFLLALALRALFVILVPYTPWSDAVVYDDRGWRLAQGLGYTSGNGELTTFPTPMYPFALAWTYVLFGHSIFAARILNVVLDSLSTILILLTAVELSDDAGKSNSSVPFVSGVLYAVNPVTIYMAGVMMTEILFIFFFMFMVFLVVRVGIHFQQSRTQVGRSKHLWLHALLGILGGLAALTKAHVVPTWLYLICISTGRRQFGTKMRGLIIALLFFFLTIAPWLVRSWLFTGRAVFVDPNYTSWAYCAASTYQGPFYQPLDVGVRTSTVWEQIASCRQLLLHHVITSPVQYLWDTVRRTGHMFDLNIETFILSFSELIYGRGYSRASIYMRSNPLVGLIAILPMLQSIVWIGGGIAGLYSRFALTGRKFILTIVGLWVFFYAIITGFPRYFIPMLSLLTIPLAHLVICFKERRLSCVDANPPARYAHIRSDVTITLVLILVVVTWITTGMKLISRVQ